MSRSRSVLLAFLVACGLLPLVASAQPHRGVDYGDDGYFGPESREVPYHPGLAKGYRGEPVRWELCASEGERCRVRGGATVRYGINGRFVYREVRNATFICDNQSFGDPAPRQRKVCEVLADFNAGSGYGGGYGGGNRPGHGGRWEYCAKEGDYCRLPGPATVRYGANGRYAFLDVDGGGVRCDNRSFGDPAPRQTKSCEFEPRFHGGGGYGGGGEFCAREGEFCSFRGRREVRYFADDGRAVVREFRGGVDCTNEAFGADPAPRRRKSCEILSGRRGR
jgi:hypothetical protein